MTGFFCDVGWCDVLSCCVLLYCVLLYRVVLCRGMAWLILSTLFITDHSVSIIQIGACNVG